MRRRAVLAIGLTVLGCATGAASAQVAQPDAAPLAICMQSNDPPVSVRGGDSPSGFAPALAQVIAHRLGREVRIQWFVSRDDPDAKLAKEANALLSDGKCQLVAEYPLSTDTLERPFAPTAKLPPFAGATSEDRGRWVKLGELLATRPYRLDALTVVLSSRDADRHIGRLADLADLKLGVQIATLADAIAMQYGEGQLVARVVHLPDSRKLLDAVQAGDLDAAFVDLRAFDAWRLKHPDNRLVTSGYLHSTAINMGFVGLTGEAKLIGDVDRVLTELQQGDRIAPLAKQNGLTYVAPRSPAVLPPVQRAALSGD